MKRSELPALSSGLRFPYLSGSTMEIRGAQDYSRRRSADSRLLRLDDSLTDLWVAELGCLCELALTSKTQLVLDCAGVLLIDDQGVLLAQCLIEQGVSFVNCSPYVAERLGLKM
jgi:myo-inositol-1-phosphate synthase